MEQGSASGDEAVGEAPIERQPVGELPMSGVRVVDVGNFLAGPYAASIMGEFGAEVLKVEHPIAGDPMRRLARPPSVTTQRWRGCRRRATRSR